jgi:hypothetical protein
MRESNANEWSFTFGKPMSRGALTAISKFGNSEQVF